MKAAWLSELDGELASIAAPPLPAILIERLCSYDLRETNEDELTLSALCNMANAAFAMTYDLMRNDSSIPDDTLFELNAYAEENTPASYLQVVGIILAAHPRVGPSPRLRKSMAQLLFATRPIARDANKPEEATLSVIRTAAFLAMWSTVYAEYTQTLLPYTAMQYVEQSFL